MALDQIDPYPWFLNKPLDLIVNEQLVRTRITSSEWVDHWRPLLARIRVLFAARLPKRFLLAIAGPPGSGKSVIAEQFHWIIERGFFHKEAHSMALPMDGFHYTNAFLETHTRKLSDGTDVPLARYKGHPETIDVKSMRRYIAALIARPDSTPWPGYSRFNHDPLPDKYHVHKTANFIIVEGNYMLLDRGPFVELPAMFDLRIYVEAPAPKIIATLVERHIQGGKDLNEAKDWVKRIDLPNARVAESTKSVADVVIERDSHEDFVNVIWKGEAPPLDDLPTVPLASPIPPAPSAHADAPPPAVSPPPSPHAH